MYRQQSFITLDQFYELKPLSKLRAILSFIDFTLLEHFFKSNPHKRGPKGYPWRCLLTALIAMQVEQIATIKALAQRMKSDPAFKRDLGFDYLPMSMPSRSQGYLGMTQATPTGAGSWTPTATSSNGSAGRCTPSLTLPAASRYRTSSPLQTLLTWTCPVSRCWHQSYQRLPVMIRPGRHK